MSLVLGIYGSQAKIGGYKSSKNMMKLFKSSDEFDKNKTLIFLMY